MAEEKEKEQKEQKEEKEKQQPEAEARSKDGPRAEASTKKSSSLGLFTWVIITAVVIAGLAGGFALAQLLAGTNSQPSDVENTKDENSPEDEAIKEMLVETPTEAKLWNYDLEPVVANLDEPGVTRYARITVTLQLSPQMNQEKGTSFLEEKKLVLRDWLTTYIAGLSLEQVRGSRNLSRIKNEIRDAFNELIFPESKPFIHGVLFKEFAIQ